jgi:valyl-tRNA synthetase
MSDKSRVQRAHIFGLGLDNADGHVRITRGENFDIYFGSESTHEQIQKTCIKINEKLDQRGKRLEDLSRDEFVDLIVESKNSRG